MSVDVVCLGETMALLTPDPLVGLSDAATLVLGHAGAESNVAVALTALGTSAAWCSRLGNDPLGHRITADLADAGVDTTLVRYIDTHPTGVMFKDPGMSGTSILYYRRGSAASTMDTSDVERALAAAPRLLHLSGITPALSRSCWSAVEHAVDRACAAGVRISFDVNHRRQLWPDPMDAPATLRALARRCHVVLVGLDEAQRLWATATADDVRACLPEPGVIVVKDAHRGAVAFTGDERVEVPALPVEVVEPVGAGDAFAAGWLHAYLAGLDAEEGLRLGHLSAATALCSGGDQATVSPSLADVARIANPWPPSGWSPP